VFYAWRCLFAKRYVVCDTPVDTQIAGNDGGRGDSSGESIRWFRASVVRFVQRHDTGTDCDDDVGAFLDVQLRRPDRSRKRVDKGRRWALEYGAFGGAVAETGFYDVFNGGIYVRSDTRYLFALRYYQQAAGLLESYTGITVTTSATQQLDTREPYGSVLYGSGPVNSTVNVEGDWTFRVHGRSAQTVCMETPIDSPSIFAHVTALKCKPEWFVNNPPTLNYHAPPSGTIYIAVPTAFMSAYVAAQQAAADWANALGRNIEALPNTVCQSGDPLCVGFKDDHGTRQGDAG
jgi:hypothetical protein